MSSSTEKHIAVTKTARYYVSNAAKGKVRNLWIVCHGYRQLAAKFINKFSPLFADDALVVAPEGFHRFYIEGYSGRVGASWMTREDRLNDIKDYVSFLDQLLEQIKKDYLISDNCKINVLGFSQGAATACRWVSSGKFKPDNLILWAGVFPPDLQENFAFQSLRTFVLLGDQDEFTTTEIFKTQEEELKKMKIDYRFIGFKGKHDIYPEPLVYLSNKLKS
jgi:predicted esterase